MAILPGFGPQLQPGVKNAIGTVTPLPITNKAPIKTPISIPSQTKTGIVGGFGGAVSPQEVTALQPSVQANNKAIEAQKSADMVKNLGNLSEKEIAFVQKAKAQGFTKEEAASYIANKRTEIEQDSSTVRNIGEGLVDFAGGIPKAVGETGILDKPAAALAKGVASGLSYITGNPYKVKDEKYSDYAAGSQVGGNPESTAAKVTSNIENVAALADVGVGLVGGVKNYIKSGKIAKLAQSALKGTTTEEMLTSEGKNILNIIKETEKVGDKRAALKGGRLLEQNSGIKNALFGGKEVVQASQRSKDAAGTILSTIKGASQEPVKLYGQVTNKIGEVANALGSKLQDIKVGSLTKKNAEIKSTLTNLASEIKDISSGTAKKITQLQTKLGYSKTANDVWEGLKELDRLIPENIKRGVNLSGKDQIIRDAWRAAREAGNTHLDEIANSVSDVQVKAALKTMSNLYHAAGQIESKIGELTKPTAGLLSKAGDAIKGSLPYAAGAYALNKITGAVTGD